MVINSWALNSQHIAFDHSHREGERKSTRSIQPAWLMRTDPFSCEGHLHNGCEAMADSLSVFVIYLV